MSRAFVKEDAAGDEPLLIPPRAPLPAGATNYVTPRGMDLLRAEVKELEAERERVLAEPEDGERKRKLRLNQGRLNELADRIASARLVEREDPPPDRVRFGVSVTVLGLSGVNEGRHRVFEIVGVDEANPGQGRIAFAAPIAKALLGLRVGEVATLRTGRGEEELEVVSIGYRNPSG